MKIIEIEGITGAGKTTLIEPLKRLIEDELNLSVMIAKEPGLTPLGENIRSLLIGDFLRALNPLTEMFLFLANRADIHYKYLQDNKDYDVVLFDRYYASTFVYQVAVPDMWRYEDLLVEAMQAITERSKWNFVDLSIVLDVDEAVAFKRIRLRQQSERRSPNELGSLDEFIRFNGEARKAFKMYSTKMNLVNNKSYVINSSGCKSEVLNNVYEKIKGFVSSL